MDNGQLTMDNSLVTDIYPSPTPGRANYIDIIEITEWIMDN